VGIRRMDDDAADVLRLLEPHELPRLAAVRGFIDPHPGFDGGPRIFVAGALPDLGRVGWRDSEPPHRDDALIVEDRSERRPGVGGLPDPTAGGRDIKGLRRTRDRRDVRDAPSEICRSDVPPAEPREGDGIELGPPDCGEQQCGENRRKATEAHGWGSVESRRKACTRQRGGIKGYVLDARTARVVAAKEAGLYCWGGLRPRPAGERLERPLRERPWLRPRSPPPPLTRHRRGRVPASDASRGSSCCADSSWCSWRSTMSASTPVCRPAARPRACSSRDGSRTSARR